MPDYAIVKNDREIGFQDAIKFVGAVDTLLQLGEQFVVTLVKDADDVVQAVNQIFQKHGVEISVSADSDPELMDYIANTLLFGIAGGAVGAIGGGAAFVAARAAGYVVPGLGQFLLVGSILGAIVGGATGIAVTRWGLKITLSPLDPNKVDVEFLPMPD